VNDDLDFPLPTIIIHDLRHARAAMAAATALGVRIRLLSAPFAAVSLGVDVFREIIDIAKDDVPKADFVAVLDCGDAPGIALSALRGGIRAVRVTACKDVLEKLADIAEQLGAIIDTDTGEAFDLLSVDDPETACREWLRVYRMD
jgi:hypothetical protein